MLDRSGLVWDQTPEANIARISGELPPAHEWRRFLDQLRPSSKPLLLWIRGRVWIGLAGRTELARAIGSSKVALVVDDDIGRGLATALRWMGSDVHAYDLGELDQVEASLGLTPGAALTMVHQLMR
ncbi:MAG: hypothetical protein R6X02_26275 [Enhygromyxa sp.]